MPFGSFPLKGDVFLIPNSRLNTLLSTKSGLGNATNIFKMSVTRPVHSNSWNRRKPFLKSTPKMAVTIMATKNAEDPIVVIIIMRNVNHGVPRD
jgi:hypothetical protein